MKIMVFENLYDYCIYLNILKKNGICLSPELKFKCNECQLLQCVMMIGLKNSHTVLQNNNFNFFKNKQGIFLLNCK